MLAKVDSSVANFAVHSDVSFHSQSPTAAAKVLPAADDFPASADDSTARLLRLSAIRAKLRT